MKYIASWSGGKDSTASIILAHEHNEPLDLIIFSEVMFDENISGELPEHIDFVKNKAIPVFESWGYEVKILHSDKTYMDCFHQKLTDRSSHKELVGMKWGFPRVGQCVINSQCKIKQIKKFWKEIGEDFVQYIGIAVDEPARMERVVKAGNQMALLEKYGYTEQMAFDLCKKYDLLSPIYSFTNRGGCWFCPNMRYAQLKHLRTHHRDLWQKLLELENEPDLIGNMWNTLTKTRIHDWEERFFWEGKKIFEGDIVGFIDLYSTESGYSESGCLGEVIWGEEECCFHVTNRLSAESREVLDECKVVGNVFDNKELLDEL